MRKNKKFIDPRYFMEEKTEEYEFVESLLKEYETFDWSPKRRDDHLQRGKRSEFAPHDDATAVDKWMLGMLEKIATKFGIPKTEEEAEVWVNDPKNEPLIKFVNKAGMTMEQLAYKLMKFFGKEGDAPDSEKWTTAATKKDAAEWRKGDSPDDVERAPYRRHRPANNPGTYKGSK